MTCNEVSERVVDYLYGELAPAQRAEVDVHLGGCAGCRREIEELGGVRQQARQALEGPLGGSPPPRVRQAVLEAARAAARAGARAPSVAVSAEGVAVWQRLWSWLRRPWFAPAFVTVSAMVIFLVARGPLFDGPNRALDEALQGSPAPAERAAEEAPAPRAEPTERAEGTPAPVAGEAAPSDEPSAESSEAEAAPAEERVARGRSPLIVASENPPRPQKARVAASGGKGSGFAVPPPARRSPSRQSVSREDKKKSAPVARRIFAEGISGAASPASPPPARLGAQAPGAPLADATFLVESPGRAEEVAAAEDDAPVVEMAVSAPARTAAAPAARPSAPPARSVTARAAAARASAARPSDEPAQLIKRAEALFAEKRYAEAARIYADLVRRFPEHPDLARWKKRRVAASEAAASEAAAAKP